MERFPDLFRSYVSANLPVYTAIMKSIGLNITNMVTINSFLPTGQPTMTPSLTPVTSQPSAKPTATSAPTPDPNATTPTKSTNNLTIVVIIIGVAVGALVLLFVICFVLRKRKRAKKQSLPSNALVPIKNKSVHEQNTGMLTDPSKPQYLENPIDPYNDGYESPEKSKNTNSYHDYFDDQQMLDESVVSNQSLISAAETPTSDSDEEEDETNNLVDEFDVYKNQNLETMRNNVESAVSDSDVMMSQALTKALMEVDHFDAMDRNERAWGGTRNPNEIESAVLWETHDWLKKKEGAEVSEKYVYQNMHVFVFVCFAVL